MRRWLLPLVAGVSILTSPVVAPVVAAPLVATPPPVAPDAGPVGGWLEDGLRLLIGSAVALAPAVLIALGIGLLAALWPAVAAMRMRVVAALRNLE